MRKQLWMLIVVFLALLVGCTEVSEDTGNNDNYSDNTTNSNTNTDNDTNNDNYNDNYNDNNTNTSYTVYFYAGEVNWDEVYVYSWDDYNKNEAWPGERMSSDGNGWYSATVNYPKIIFNGGNGGPQTGDLKSQDGYFVPENSGSSISGTWYTSKPNVGNTPEPDYPEEPDDPEPDYPDDPYYPDEPEEISAPSSLSAYATSESSISLSWSYVSGATFYLVYYGTSNSIYNAEYYDYYTGTSAQITELSAGTTYYFWVIATDGTLKSDFSSMEYATTEKSSTATIYFVGSNNVVGTNYLAIGNYKFSNNIFDIQKSSKALSRGTIDGPYTIPAGTYLVKIYNPTTNEVQNGYRVKNYKGQRTESSLAAIEETFEVGKVYTIYKDFSSIIDQRTGGLITTSFIKVQEGTD